MPTWSTELPALRKHMGFDIRRTPAATPTHAIITCNDLLVCDTHYWGGRTIPCERHTVESNGKITASTCPACNESIPYRTHVYISAFDCKTSEHFIFECTAHAAKPLDDYRRSTGTLRGCIFHATRPKGKKNSKVVIETNTANLGRTHIPDPPDLILALSTIWRLPTTGLRKEERKHRSPKLRTQPEPINRMREQPDNQPDPVHISEVLAGNGQKKPK